jgi:hypothetical protein
VQEVAPPPIEPIENVSLDTMVSTPLGDLANYSQKAHDGQLSENDVAALKAVVVSDPDYSRSRVLLYEDAKARGDLDGRQAYMNAVMEVAENRYNPTLLIEEAELAILRKDYRGAVDQANAAERQWQRLPSDILFSRKAMIYEIQAAGYQGLFYESGGDDMDSLANAIRAWEKYRRHAETRSRTDMSDKADKQLAKLQDMQKRLE